MLHACHSHVSYKASEFVEYLLLFNLNKSHVLVKNDEDLEEKL